MLEIENAVCGYRRGRRIKKVIDGISMTVKPGEVMCILGSNGIGKTTLFRSVMGGLPLLGGSVRIDGKDLSELSIRERAGKIGYVPQSHTPPFPFTAAQVTVMGRTSHMQMFASASRRDYEIAEEALELMGYRLSERRSLYGDQRRRTPAGAHRQSGGAGIGLSDHGRTYVESRFRKQGSGAAPCQTTGRSGKGHHHDHPRPGSRFCGIRQSDGNQKRRSVSHGRYR